MPQYDVAPSQGWEARPKSQNVGVGITWWYHVVYEALALQARIFGHAHGRGWMFDRFLAQPLRAVGADSIVGRRSLA